MDKVSTYRNTEGEEVKQSTSQKALVFRDGLLLLAKNEHTGELCVPGGREQVGESTEETLVREIAEETGYKCLRLIGFTLVQENTNIFRSPKDGEWRHIDQKWNLCEVEIDDESNPRTATWADYELANQALARDHEQEILVRIKPLFKS